MDTLVSPGFVWYAEKEEKLFWFSLLIQLGTINVCRILENFFGWFVWIEKSHYYSRVMKRRQIIQKYVKHS